MVSMVMVGIEVPLAKLSTWARTHQMMAAKAMYTSAMHVLVPAAQKIVREKNIVFTGQLFQKIAVRVTHFAGRAAVDFGTIGVPYSLNVEKGQPPGTTQSLKKLIRYARLKMGLDEASAGRVGAFLKAKIEAEGTRARPFIEPAFTMNRERFTLDYMARLRVLMGIA